MIYLRSKSNKYPFVDYIQNNFNKSEISIPMSALFHSQQFFSKGSIDLSLTFVLLWVT
jgi:hypothetical protein